MAFISLGSQTWHTGPKIVTDFAYEKQRSGSDMQYRIRITVNTLEYSASYFGYPIYMKTSLDGSLKDTHTIKEASPSKWSSPIVYTTDWITISNKTSGSVSLSLNIYSGSGNSTSKTYSYSLGVDPAASVLGGINNFIIGNAFTIPITKYDSSFTDTLTVTVANTVIKTVTGITNGYSFNFSDSELNTIYSKLSSKETASFTFELTTRSGGTLIGNSSSRTVMGTIPSNIQPSISSVGVFEAGSVPGDWGVHVKNKSRIRFTINASPGSGSNITNIKTVINGSSYNGSDITTNIINVSGNLTATITVTDARNRSVSINRAINILDYFEPDIRMLNAFRCDSEGNANDNGDHLYVHFTASICSLDGKNTNFSHGVQWKKTTDSNYQTYMFGATGAEIDSYAVLPDIEKTSSYDVRVLVTDYFNQNGIIKSAKTVSSVFRTINFKAGGHGIGIGKMAEEDNLLDIGLPTKLAGGINGDIIMNDIHGRIYWKEPGYGDQFAILPTFPGADNANKLKIMSAVGDAGTKPDLHDIATIESVSGIIDAGGFYDRGSVRSLPNGEDILDYWRHLQNGWYWYGNTGAVANMPSAYGFVEKRGFIGGDFTILYYTQGSGSIYRKSGNNSFCTGWIKIYQTQNILWEGAHYMNASQTAYLSEKVSDQVNGIVLVFSGYTDGTVRNWNTTSRFIPKQKVASLNGIGEFVSIGGTEGISGFKYLYIYDDRIEGNNKNETTITNGITYDNTYYVLRYVIGV